MTDAINNRPLTVSHGGHAAASHNDHPALGADPTPDQQRPRRVPTVKSRPRRVQIYVAVKNDNLTKIARKFYGQATPRTIEAIFQANRKALRDRNSLKVGQKLEIPIPDDTATAAADARPAEPRRKTVPGTHRGWRWYQVKNNDRYSRIAQEQLGDAGRWKELYALNKDIFPDPDRIRPGVRIKIPE